MAQIWRAYWRDSDGVLVAHGWMPDKTPPTGVSTRSYGTGQPVGEWDTTLRDYDGVAAKPRIISTFQFMTLWTQDERGLLRENTTAPAKDFTWMLQVSGEVDLDHPYIIEKLTQAKNAGILTVARAQAIQRGDDL